MMRPNKPGSVVDFLTCGSCQAEFPLSNIVYFMQHKKSDCNDLELYESESENMSLHQGFSCFTCPKRFHAAVSLLQHAQYQHQQQIFKDLSNKSKTSTYNDNGHISSNPVKPSTDIATLEPQFNSQQVSTEPVASAMISTNNSEAADTFERFADVTEPLSKCCTSVVPKKRKRHIETKHRNPSIRFTRKTANMFSHSQMATNSASIPSDIYIDVDQSSADGDLYTYNSSSPSPAEQRLLLKPGDVYKLPISSSHGGRAASATISSEYVGISYSGNSRRAADITRSAAQQMVEPADGAAGGGGGSDSHPNSSTPAGSDIAGSLPHNSSNQTSDATSDVQNSSPPLQNQQQQLEQQQQVTRKKYPTSKPFKCDYCEHSFNQRIHLKKHLSKHTGVKPYKCGQCNYATVERSHLKVHIRIHTGEKPFKCDHCEYATAQNSTLKIHLKRHHGSLFLECSHCGKSFPKKQELVKHKQQQHIAGADEGHDDDIGENSLQIVEASQSSNDDSRSAATSLTKH